MRRSRRAHRGSTCSTTDVGARRAGGDARPVRSRQAAAENGHEQDGRNREHDAGRDADRATGAPQGRSRDRPDSPWRRRTPGTAPPPGRRTRSPGPRSGCTSRRSPAASRWALPSITRASQRTIVTANAAIPKSSSDEQMGDREEEAEEDGEARALEVVGDDDADRQAVLLLGIERILPVHAVDYDRPCPAAPITPRDVAQAAATIRGAVHRTPIFSSRSLGPGRYLKAELFQKTGSFKARGALNRVRCVSRDERERGVISVSAGNHAQALAWAASTEGGRFAHRDVARGEHRQDRRHAGDTGPRSTSRRPAPVRRSTACEALQEATGRVLVHPSTTRSSSPGQGPSGWRSSRTCRTWTRSSSPAAAEGSSRGSRPPACRTAFASSRWSRSTRTHLHSGSLPASRWR